MQLLTNAILKKMPLPDSITGKAEDAPIIVKFFGGGSYTLYVIAAYAWIEGKEVKLSEINGRPYDDIFFFGYVTGLQADEWGYTTLNQLKDIKFPPFSLGIERDMYFGNNTVKGLK